MTNKNFTNTAQYQTSLRDADIAIMLPTPKDFIMTGPVSEFKKAELLFCKIYIPLPDIHGIYCIYYICQGPSGRWDGQFESPYDKPFTDIVTVDPHTSEQVVITARDIYRCLKYNYDFTSAFRNYRNALLAGTVQPSIAFTVKDSSVKGGGTIVLYKYINWLAELGVDVAVYSNDRAPDWIDVDARFYHIKNDRERYIAIKESVVIVYAVGELQDLLCFADTSNKVIYHICQGLEEHHYGHKTYRSLMSEKPIFGFLFSLPVGRIAVSPHISSFFNENYGQQTHNIYNGIDTNFFTPPTTPRVSGDTINILSSGDPTQIFKGKSDIRKALNILADSMPNKKFHLTIVNGAKLKQDCFDGNGDRFTFDLKFALSPRQMLNEYHTADIYINSSWYEGFGLPSLEAMACAVPVIQTDNCGLTGIAADKQNCLLIPPDDPQAMAQAISTLVNDDSLRSALTKNGSELASEFSIDNQHKMFVSEFEKILGCELKKNTSSDNPIIDTEDSDQPLFSILVPTYNQAHFLPEALDSIIAQTYPNWEALVVNDGSTDNTEELLNKYAQKDTRFRIFKKQNGGAGSALNEGLKNARGKWICWLSSDDYFEPNKLEIHLKAIKQRPDIKFFHTHYYFIDKTGKKRQGELDQNTSPAPDDLQVLKFFQSNYFNGISICIAKEVFDELGPFDESFRYGQDFDMWLRISSRYRSMFINSRTCVTRQYEDQVTSKYPLIGIYDSSRACVEYLNKHNFEQLFPVLDLSTTEHAVHAVKSTLAVLMNPSSFVNLSGTAPVLLDRMHEWLSAAARMELRSALKLPLTQIIKSLREMKLSDELTSAFEQMLNEFDKPFTFQPYNALNEMSKHVGNLQKYGRADQAQALKQYLTKIIEFLRSRNSDFVAPQIDTSLPDQTTSRKTGLKIGMAVLAQERPEYLEICLNTLFKTNLHDYDVTFLLQDDGSKDPRVKQILQKSRDPEYKIVHHLTPKGPNCAGAAINKAMRRLLEIDDFDVIGWCDPDCLFHPDWLDNTMKICLWARNNHKSHTLGPFTSFNSSDYKFHQILGSYKSPYGNYLVKRQAGMLNYFYLKEDFLKFGFFPENKDDETLMTQKLEFLGVRNLCTETSYVEHIGQDSVLNQYRPTPVTAAVHGMNLVETGWPEELKKVATLGYFASVKENPSLDPWRRSNMKLDILIPVIEKDIEVLGWVVRGLKENLKHPIGRIITVGPDTNKVKFVSIAEGCQFIPEDSILPIKKSDIQYTVNGMDRSGWLFQQLLKWSGDLICSSENYLVMDADTVLIRPQVFEVDSKFVLLHSDEHHQPYFDLYKRLFGRDTTTAISCVSHQMLFNGNLIKQLRNELETIHRTNWLDALFKNIDGSQLSGMSEYELYGQWLLANHPDKIERQYWFNLSLPRHELANLKKLKNEFNEHYRSISFHEYQKPVDYQTPVQKAHTAMTV